MVFLHGLGLGVAPYADWVAALPKDRPIVVPEWPNISYGTDLGARYPTPSELADFLERTTQQASDDAAAADELLSPSVSSRSVGPPRKCDVIAHSYGTVVLTGRGLHSSTFQLNLSHFWHTYTLNTPEYPLTPPKHHQNHPQMHPISH